MYSFLVKSILKLFLIINNKFFDSIIEKAFKYKKYYFVELNHEKFTKEWHENCKFEKRTRFIYLIPSFLNNNNTVKKKLVFIKQSSKLLKM